MQEMANQATVSAAQAVSTISIANKRGGHSQNLIADPFLQIFANMMAQAQQPQEGEVPVFPSTSDDENQNLNGMTVAQTMLSWMLAQNQITASAEFGQIMADSAATNAIPVELSTDNLFGKPQAFNLSQNIGAFQDSDMQDGMTDIAKLMAEVPIIAAEYLSEAESAEKPTNFAAYLSELSDAQKSSKPGGTTTKQTILVDTDTASSAQAVSVDKPQLTWATERKSEAISQEPKLLEQLNTGIKENLKTGKREFILKLKPESLGEITVRLIEKSGKMTLSIATSNPQTAKLINNELGVLRDTMQPMHVEVHEAVSSTSESQQSSMQQFSMMNQQFADSQREHTYKGAFTTEIDSDVDALENEIGATKQSLDGFDTYV